MDKRVKQFSRKLERQLGNQLKVRSRNTHQLPCVGPCVVYLCPLPRLKILLVCVESFRESCRLSG